MQLLINFCQIEKLNEEEASEHYQMPGTQSIDDALYIWQSRRCHNLNEEEAMMLEMHLIIYWAEVIS